MAKRLGGTESLSEALTERERNILAHLANERSSQEIAGLETLAPSSVKWYIHQVYAKLSVNRRADAVARAKELGLLGPKSSINLSAPPQRNNNLPRQLTTFIGREAEIATLLAWVQTSGMPLITLTGSGGTGKTRLALQVAAKALPFFTDGVWLVSLAPLADPDRVPQVTASAIGMHELPQTESIPALRQFIDGKHILLILDNCEHLVGAVAELVFALLQACPRLHILATSREMLGVEGEKTHRCPPLSLPDPRARVAFAELAQFEAVRLFHERARSASPNFVLNEANASEVARICQRLDGIPLAIELAAARMRILSLDQISARLDNVFHLLTGGGRTALLRHQTLKALVDWSYNLLSEKEQLLLCRLSVFAGTWTLEAAEAVCACPVCGGVPIPAEEILALLGQLADKSLIERVAAPEGPATEPRYRILEMIRQYAQHRLEETESVAALRERHLDYYLALGLEAEPHLRSKKSREWRRRLNAEIDNLRLALEGSFAGQIEKGLRLAAALYWYWFASGNRIEGVGWLNRLLAAEAADTGQVDPDSRTERKIARGKALNASSYMGILIGQDGQAMGAEAAAIFQSLGDLCPVDLAYSRYLSGEMGPDEGLAIFQELGETFLTCEMAGFLTQRARWRGELDLARRCAERHLQLNRAASDRDGESSGLWELASLDLLDGNYPQALSNAQACQACYDEQDGDEIYPFPIRFYAWIALLQGDLAKAIVYSQAQLSASRRRYSPWIVADALGFLGWEALTNGDLEQAARICEEALSMRTQVAANLLSIATYVQARIALARGETVRARAFIQAFVNDNYHSWPPVQLGIQLFGMLALAEGQPTRAATLFGAQDAISDNLLNVIPAPEREAYRNALSAVRAQLSAQEYASAWEKGKAMSTAQAIQYALDEPVPAS